METTLRQRIDELERRRAQDHREIRSAIAAGTRAGLSQREIAARIGKSQPEVSRLVTASAARTAAGLRRTWMTARSAVDAATRELRDGDEMMAFRMIVQAIDHLGALEDPDDIAEWAVTPGRIPHEGLDTLLQALTRREFQHARKPAPPWAAPESLLEEWILAASPRRIPRVKSRTPDFLADLGVYVSDRDLVTA